MARTALFSQHQPGGVFTISNLEQHPGSIFFVHSGTGTDGAGYGQNPDAPVATLDYAVGLCTASKGDVIYILPGHAENLVSATALTMDVAGVAVIGLGRGSLRPTFSLTTHVGATWNITAANCTVKNVVIVGNFLNVAAAVTIGAAAHYTTLQSVETRDTSAVLGALIQISVAAGATDVSIDDYQHVTFTGGLTAPATNVILCAGAADRFKLTRSRIYAHTSAAPVALAAAASKFVYINGVDLTNTDTSAGLGIAAHNSTTGFVDNVVTVNLKNGVAGVTGTGLSIGPRVNYSNAVNAYAGLFSYTIDS